MKTRSFFLWAATLSACAIPALLLAQNDNPTGEAGVFNGTINTGGSYEAYTQNATRVVPDLPVVGAVGEIPLVFARIFNSRKKVQLPPSGFPEEACWWGEGTRHLGDGGNWRHSYQWEVRTTVAMPSSPAGPTRLLDPLFNGPDQNIRVHTPDGRELTFSASSTDTPYWRAGAGTPERLKLVGSTQNVAGTDHLILKAADGSETKLLLTCYFEEEILDRGEEVVAIYYYRYYQPVSLTDRFGRVTTLAYDTSGRLVVTEPGGRWLRLAYTSFGGATRIDTVTSCYGQVVKMNYSSFGSGSWSVLSSVDYQFDPLPGTSTPKSATYTYETPLSGASGCPVLKTADDPRFPGAMTKIKYLYQTTTGSGNGWLSEEQYTDGTMVSRIEKDATTGQRTETRGDGATRVFNYTGTRLTSYSNWRDPSELTELVYDANNYLSEVYPPIATRSPTVTTREAVTGKVTQVTRPDGSTVQYFYTSTTEPYFLDHTIAENGVTTTYARTDTSFPNMISRIDYPDGSYETFTYTSSALKLPATQRTRTGAIKNYTFDDYSAAGPRSGVLQVPTAAQTWKGLLTKTWVTGVTGDSAGANLARWMYYDDNGRPVNLFGARGYREILDYDTADRVIKKTHDGNQHTGSADFTDSSYSQVFYDARGNVSEVRDEVQTATSSNGTRMQYDDYRRPTEQTDPANRLTKFFYYPPGSSSVSPYRTTFATPGVVELPGHVPTTAPRLIWNEFTPDFWPYRRTTGADTTSDLAWEELTYLADGQVDETWNNYNGSLVPTAYKKKNIYHAVTGKLDRIYEMGNSSPQRQTIFTYASTTGWLEKTEYPDTKSTLITQWDVFGRPKKIKDERNNEIEKVFHVGGPLHKLIDSNGKEYVYLIDELGRTIETKYPVVGTGAAPYETVTFGLDGLATQMRNRNAQLTTPYFDHRARATVIEVDSGVPVQGKKYLFEYDAAGRPEELWTYVWSTKVSDWAVDTKISRDYGIDGSLEQERQWNRFDSVSRDYTYTWSTGTTGTGLLDSLALPSSGGTIAYGWTQRNMIESVTGTGFGTGQPASVSATFTYLPSAQLQKIQFGNGMVTGFAYDDADRVQFLHTYRPDPSGNPESNIAHRQYGYDARDRMQWFVHTGSAGQPWEDWRGDRYEYFDDGQLQHAWHEGVMIDYTAPPPTPPTPTPGTIQAHGKSKFTYAFDPVGNRQSETYTGPSGTASSPTTYTSNARNEYTAVGAVTPGYGDGRGNLTSLGSQSFTYDAENRLVSATQNSVAKIEFTYDALGRCVHRLTTNLATSAIENQALYYDGGNVVEEYSRTGTSGSYYRSAVNFSGAWVDHQFATLRWNSSGTAIPGYYRVYDARNSVTHLVSTDDITVPTHAYQNIVEAYRYDAFGNPTLVDTTTGGDLSASSSLSLSAKGNRFTFTGREWLHGVGVYDYRARHYHPGVGRFLQPDPIGFAGADQNLYRYCHNRPPGLRDPLGLYTNEDPPGPTTPPRVMVEAGAIGGPSQPPPDADWNNPFSGPNRGFVRLDNYDPSVANVGGSFGDGRGGVPPASIGSSFPTAAPSIENSRVVVSSSHIRETPSALNVWTFTLAGSAFGAASTVADLFSNWSNGSVVMFNRILAERNSMLPRLSGAAFTNANVFINSRLGEVGNAMRTHSGALSGFGRFGFGAFSAAAFEMSAGAYATAAVGSVAAVGAIAGAAGYGIGQIPTGGSTIFADQFIFSIPPFSTVAGALESVGVLASPWR